MFVYHTKVDGAEYPKKAYGTKYFKNTHLSRAKRMASSTTTLLSLSIIKCVSLNSTENNDLLVLSLCNLSL